MQKDSKEECKIINKTYEAQNNENVLKTPDKRPLPFRTKNDVSTLIVSFTNLTASTSV